MSKPGLASSKTTAETGTFVYPPVPAPPRPPQTGGGNNAQEGPAKNEQSVQSMWANSWQAQLTGKSQEQLQAHERQAYEQGARDAEAKIRADCEAALVNERKKVAQTLEAFDRERKTYFERVEGEVVQLALAVARKILHREAQIDPLFLAGAVRVALEKVAAGSAVKLRVPETDIFKWRQIVALLKNVQPQPEVVGDPALPSGRCIMETDVGSTNISLDTQFREIERGLLDLLALRPAS